MIEKKADRGEKVEALENQPVLYEDLFYIWEMFWTLSNAREVGWQVCPFRLSDIFALLDERELEGDDRAEAFRLLRKMDDAWLKKNADSRTSN